jgi:dipeptidyl aminopeptidase/acylaminoacyl peptidase
MLGNRILYLLGLILMLSSLTYSQNKISLKEAYSIDRFLNIRSASLPTVSPDGNQVAFLTNITGTSQVWTIDSKGGWPDQRTFYMDNVDFVSWSPAGNGLIFTKAKGGDENAQLFWLSADGSQVRTLTDDPTIRHISPIWSHDGKHIAYGSNRRDRKFFDIYVMNIGSGKEELIYKEDGSNKPVAWSYDNQNLIISRDSDQLALDNDLYLVNISSKESIHLTPHKEPTLYEHVHFTSDGRSIILSTNHNREWSSLARMDLNSKQLSILHNLSWDLSDLDLSEDGSWLAYTVNHAGYSDLYICKTQDLNDISNRSISIKLPGKGVISSLNFFKDNSRLAFSFTGARYPSDIWIYNLKNNETMQLTRSTRAGIPDDVFVEPELVEYKSFDNLKVPAWYYRPKGDVANAQKALNKNLLPVIVSVHGGPEAQERPIFSAVYQHLLTRGYAILAPNVRGSVGYGKTYTHLDDVRKREDSVKDLAAAVDWLKSQSEIDSNRIAVMGGSYGGYMTLAAITLYPDLWVAAVNTVGIVNFESFLKNTAGYRRKLREVEYGSLDKDLEFLRSISPLNKVDRIRTPLMVIHGKNDPRVPYTEAEQIVKALKSKGGSVEYELFEDEGHGIRKLSNRLKVYPKVVEFFDRYMGNRVQSSVK